MSIENKRALIIGNIWQAIAQSKVDLTAVPKEQQTELVDAVADNLLITLDSLLQEAAPMAESTEEVLEGDEQIVWTGRPFLSLTETYTVTTERIKVRKGLLGKDIENFELIRLQDIDFSQTISERVLGLGDLVIRGHDASHAKLLLRNVRDPEKVYEQVRRAWLDARKRYGLTFQEEM
jgi:hypothetical protein